MLWEEYRLWSHFGHCSRAVTGAHIQLPALSLPSWMTLDNPDICEGRGMLKKKIGNNKFSMLEVGVGGIIWNYEYEVSV